VPTVLIGALAYSFIKAYLFDPWVVVTTLVLGGLAILWIERHLPAPRYHSVETMPAMVALGVGFCQVVSMIPGVSRAGATIMGGLLLGIDRRTATEFSFFLAVPTMLAASTLDLYENWRALSSENLLVIAIGFVAAFVSALLVVRWLIRFVSRHGFGPFAWYRIAIGLVMALILLLR
jgi:undecaprenyl-diphosphatase